MNTGKKITATAMNDYITIKTMHKQYVYVLWYVRVNVLLFLVLFPNVWYEELWAVPI